MTTKTQSRVDQAIEQSWRENRSVTIHDATPAEYDDLIGRADDSTTVHGELDAWGTTDDGYEWRVFAH